MPLYEYECPRCGRFEKIQKFSSRPLKTCPTCGKGVERLLSAPAIQFKGSGWYVTDYAGKADGKAEAKGDGKGESKSDGKSGGDKDSGGDKAASASSDSSTKSSTPKKDTSKKGAASSRRSP